MKPFQRLCAPVIVGLLVGCLGCGEGGRTTFDPTGKDKLEEISQMLRTVQADRMKPPARVAELERVEPMIPLSVQDLRSGEIVYVWGASLSSNPEASNTVIAHEKKAASEGGWVLLQDGKVKQMSADTFRSSSRAGR
jgi:hypothetical protein